MSELTSLALLSGRVKPLAIALGLCCALQTACRTPSDAVIVDEDASGFDVETGLPDRCQPGTSWAPGARAFEETTEGRGLVENGVSGVRISVTDIDGDGLADLVVRRGGSREDDFSEGGERAVWLLRNTGQGRFEDITVASNLLKRRDGDTTRGRAAEIIAWADVNNDGHLDAVTLFSNLDDQNLLRYGAEVMLNDGTGAFDFAPVSEPLHMANTLVSRGGAAFVDVDRDGFVDLWIGHGSVTGQGPTQDRLLLGDGTGRFTDGTEARGLSTLAWTQQSVLNEARGHSNAWSVAACDLTGDGTPELLAASYGRAPNHLWLGASRDGQTTYQNHAIA
jgi:enediyne biosynthesis protein E4